MQKLLGFLCSILFAATALSQAPPAAPDCELTAIVFASSVDATHTRFVIAIQSKCSNGAVKVYTSREAVVDIDAPGAKEVGAVLMQAQAVEVSNALNADGITTTAEEILEHVQLVDKGAPPPPSLPETGE